MNYQALSVMLVALALTLVTGCKQTLKEVTLKNGKTYKTQMVHDSVPVDGAAAETFAFYLPQQYNGKTALPVLYLIDPHAEGAKPVELYKQAANEKGYIIVASNALQNGLSQPESAQIFSRLMATVNACFVIDAKRQFVGGFSGGAKIAMILAFDNPQIIGVLACGGTIPMASSTQPNFYFAGIVGDADFNYLECRQSFSVFESYGYDYTAQVFSGGHQWPPVSYFKQALNGFDIYAMKLKLTDIDTRFLDQLKKSLTDSANLCASQKRLIDQYEYYQQLNRWFYGLQPVTDIKKQILSLQNSPLFTKQLQTRQQALQKEISLRTQFVRAIGTQDLAWWQSEIEKFNSFDTQSADLKQVKKRLLSYLSMVSFSLVKADLDAQNLTEAAKKIEIYKMVDPTNYDTWLMQARYYMLMNDTQNMKAAYAKAVELGFKSVKVYANQSAWRPLLEQVGAM